MIVVKLDRLLLERRMTLSDLARRVGIALPNLSLLKTGKVKEIRFALLDALCRELACAPGDILGCDAPAGEGSSAVSTAATISRLDKNDRGGHAHPHAPPAAPAVNAGIDFID
jgi:putative transcriptional regulator